MRREPSLHVHLLAKHRHVVRWSASCNQKSVPVPQDIVDEAELGSRRVDVICGTRQMPIRRPRRGRRYARLQTECLADLAVAFFAAFV